MEMCAHMSMQWIWLGRSCRKKIEELLSVFDKKRPVEPMLVLMFY